MKSLALAALLPAVLACTNPDTDPCASFMTAQAATASPFCATFTQSVVTATAGLPAWATVCSMKTSALSKECTCAFSGAAATSTQASTTLKTSTTTAGSTGATVTATGTCTSPNYALVGYAAGTTGGGSGSGTTVTSCSALTTAAKAGGVIKISGALSGCGIIDLISSTTVIGVGSSSGLVGGGGFRVKGASNVILRNLKMKNSPEGKDIIEIQDSTKVWVDHCDLSNDGITGDKDYYDGLLDITHGSDFVTVSYNKFHDHWKGSLIGHSDNNADEDTGKLHVTYHHNHFSNVNSRLPSIRFGVGHIYSSCYENNPTSGINSRMGAQVLVEQNYFLNTPLSVVTDLDSDEDGYAVERNNIYSGTSTTRITQTGSLTPPYSYTLDAASCICSMVKAYAGTGIVA